MKMARSQFDWLKQHAELENDILVCRKTRKPISQAVIGRSIWIRPFMGGAGEVKPILDVACLDCNPAAIPPKYGAPIYEDELVESGLEPVV